MFTIDNGPGVGHGKMRAIGGLCIDHAPAILHHDALNSDDRHTHVGRPPRIYGFLKYARQIGAESRYRNLRSRPEEKLT